MIHSQIFCLYLPYFLSHLGLAECETWVFPLGMSVVAAVCDNALTSKMQLHSVESISVFLHINAVCQMTPRNIKGFP